MKELLRSLAGLAGAELEEARRTREAQARRLASACGIPYRYVYAETLWEFCRRPEIEYVMNLSLVTPGGAVFLGPQSGVESRMMGLVGKVVRHGYEAQYVEMSALAALLRDADAPTGLTAVGNLCDPGGLPSWDVGRVASWISTAKHPVVVSALNFRIVETLYGRVLADRLREFCPIC